MRWLIFSALLALTALAALNWRAQLQTQQKLDALSAKLAEQPAPGSLVPVLEPKAPPKEAPAKPAYVIEAPDVLLIEAVVKDPKTGATSRLPEPPLSGPFLVRPDGTVGLGFWGSVKAAGLTLDEAKTAVRDALIQARPALLNTANLVVTVEIQASNSKRYYVIADQGGYGEQVFPFPLTGNKTVLDAITDVFGLSEIAGKGEVSLSRPAPKPGQPRQTLPVDWKAITQDGVTTTNYQLQPGDRLYVKSAK
jgi:polysaccharide export outer membrane protein